MMKPNGGEEPTADVAKVNDTYFKNFNRFQEELSQAAISRFGSGYGWLVMDDTSKELSVMSKPNQDKPLTIGKTPLLVIDVWEHAYYLKYKTADLKF